MKLSSLVLSASHVQRTRRTDKAGTGSANHVARHFKTNARRPLRDRVQLSHARAAATFASSRARAADSVTPDLVARLSARRRSRAAFSSRVREVETFDAAKRAFVGPWYVEHARQEPFFSGSYRPYPDSATSFPARARDGATRFPAARCVATRPRYRFIVDARAPLASRAFFQRGCWITEYLEA